MKLGLIKIVIYNDMLVDRALQLEPVIHSATFIPIAAIEIYADRRDRGRKLPIAGISDTGNFSW